MRCRVWFLDNWYLNTHTCVRCCANSVATTTCRSWTPATGRPDVAAMSMGEGTVYPEGPSQMLLSKNAGVGVAGHSLRVEQPSPVQGNRPSSPSPSWLCWGPALGLTPLERTLPKSKEVSSSSLSNAVCLALVPSQPTFATATLSPQNRNSWGAGPALWLHLPLHGLDFQNAWGSAAASFWVRPRWASLSLPEK